MEPIQDKFDTSCYKRNLFYKNTLIVCVLQRNTSSEHNLGEEFSMEFRSVLSQDLWPSINWLCARQDGWTKTDLAKLKFFVTQGTGPQNFL